MNQIIIYNLWNTSKLLESNNLFSMHNITICVCLHKSTFVNKKKWNLNYCKSDYLSSVRNDWYNLLLMKTIISKGKEILAFTCLLFINFLLSLSSLSVFLSLSFSSSSFLSLNTDFPFFIRFSSSSFFSFNPIYFPFFIPFFFLLILFQPFLFSFLHLFLLPLSSPPPISFFFSSHHFLFPLTH